jgi:hypothetical protein
MGNPKRHHYVPEMLQRRFVNERGMLYYFNKKKPGKGVGETGPGNLFVKSNLHTKYEAGGVKDTSLETFYSKIEGTADTIIDRIVTSARRGQRPALSATRKEEWDQFLFFQWKRVPDCHSVLYNPSTMIYYSPMNMPDMALGGDMALGLSGISVGD